MPVNREIFKTLSPDKPGRMTPCKIMHPECGYLTLILSLGQGLPA